MEKEKVASYKNLIVWQKALKLVVQIYAITERFPSQEMYGLTSQMRRAAVSIPSNIAEGSRRSTKKDFHHFLIIAYGSGSELETQIEVAKILPFGKNLNFSDTDALLIEIMKMLNSLIRKLNS